jgi:hypothetical protein
MIHNMFAELQEKLEIGSEELKGKVTMEYKPHQSSIEYNRSLMHSSHHRRHRSLQQQQQHQHQQRKKDSSRERERDRIPLSLSDFGGSEEASPRLAPPRIQLSKSRSTNDVMISGFAPSPSLLSVSGSTSLQVPPAPVVIVSPRPSMIVRADSEGDLPPASPGLQSTQRPKRPSPSPSGRKPARRSMPSAELNEIVRTHRHSLSGEISVTDLSYVSPSFFHSLSLYFS